MQDFNDYMKKIEFLVRNNPLTVHPPLNQVGKANFKASYKPISREKVRQKLLKLPKIEVEKMYNEEIQRRIEQSKAAERALWFNQSNCNADFDYWARRAYWTIDEGIALILGKDPRKTFWDALKSNTSSSFVKKFEEMRNLAAGYVSWQQLYSQNLPGVFLAWVRRMQYEIPDSLLVACEKIGIQVADWQTLYNDAKEILALKDKRIEILEDELNKLRIENEQLTDNSRLLLDETSEFYSLELDAANIIQHMVIKNFDKSVSFKQQARKYLDKFYPNLASEAKKRITIMLNPTACKVGGRPKEENIFLKLTTPL